MSYKKNIIFVFSFVFLVFSAYGFLPFNGITTVLLDGTAKGGNITISYTLPYEPPECLQGNTITIPTNPGESSESVAEKTAIKLFGNMNKIRGYPIPEDNFSISENVLVNNEFILVHSDYVHTLAIGGSDTGFKYQKQPFSFTFCGFNSAFTIDYLTLEQENFSTLSLFTNDEKTKVWNSLRLKDFENTTRKTFNEKGVRFHKSDYMENLRKYYNTNGIISARLWAYKSQNIASRITGKKDVQYPTDTKYILFTRNMQQDIFLYPFLGLIAPNWLAWNENSESMIYSQSEKVKCNFFRWNDNDVFLYGQNIRNKNKNDSGGIYRYFVNIPENNMYKLTLYFNFSGEAESLHASQESKLSIYALPVKYSEISENFVSIGEKYILESADNNNLVAEIDYDDILTKKSETDSVFMQLDGSKELPSGYDTFLTWITCKGFTENDITVYSLRLGFMDETNSW